MKVTIVMNRFGHLEIWHGDRTDKESDLYVQSEARIDDVFDYLPKEEGFSLRAGWDLATKISYELLEILL